MRDPSAPEEPSLVFMVEPRVPTVMAKVFTGPGDSSLPSNVQGLSLEKRRQWVGAWNGRFKECQDEGSSNRECESSAFAVANSAIKKELTPEEETKFYDSVESYDIWQAQFNQVEAEYDALGATGERACSNCRWFVPPGGCIIVARYPEPIVPNGLSNKWELRPVRVPEPLEVVIVEKGEEPDSDDGDKATKKEGGVDYPASDYAVVPDGDKPSGWKLRLAEGSSGNRTVAQIGRAITALQPGGFRGNQVQLTSEQKSGAVKKIGSAIGGISGASAEQKRNLRERLDGVKEQREIHISLPARLVGSAMTALKGLVGQAEPTPPFVLYKDADGSVRWFAWATNKWRDRDHPPEILSDKAHRDYVDYVDRTGDFPEAWLWHTPGSKWGNADWVDYADGFLMASGTVTPGMEHVAESLARTKGLGVSHGFQYRHSDVKGGIIGWYRTFEISPLPVAAAANPWTSLEVLQKELEETMNAQKREFLVAHLGEDETKRLETNTAELKQALEAKGVEWKDVPIDDEPTSPVIIDMKALASEAGKAAAEALVETPAFKGMVEAQAGYETRFKGIEEALAALKKTDDEKVAQLVAATAHQPNGHRASAAADNVLKGQDAEAAKKDGAGPSILDQVMEGLEIQQAEQ